MIGCPSRRRIWCFLSRSTRRPLTSFFDECRVEDEFHPVGAWSHGEGLPGQPFPPWRRLEPVEARSPRDLLQRPLPLHGDGCLEDVHEGLGRDPQAGVGVLQQFPGTPGQVSEVVSRGLTQVVLLGAAADLLLDEQADLLDRGRLALEVPLDGGVEDAFHAAQVFLNLLAFSAT